MERDMIKKIQKFYDVKEEKTNDFLSFVHPKSETLCKKKRSTIKSVPKTLFALQCIEDEEGIQTLILSGKELQSKIGRHLENWDVPYLTNFLSKNRKIKKLNLAYNDIDCAGLIGLVDYFIKRDQISDLDLSYNNISFVGINYMYNKADLLKLKVLLLNGNKLGPKNALLVALMLDKNPYIKHLEIAEIDQNEESLVYFATILGKRSSEYTNTTLKILNLNRPSAQCIQSKLDTSHIAKMIGIMLRYNESLEKLHVQKFNFYCHNVEEMLRNGKYNQTLKYLDLSCNNIGDYGAELFSMWLKGRPPALQSLLIGHNIISNHGISVLSRAIPFSKLKAIDVSYNRFNDEGGVQFFNAIKKSPPLEKLRIFGNQLGHETAKIVERMLLSKVLNQENIDIKPYIVDGVYQLAFY